MKKIQKKKSKITNNKPKQASIGTERRRAERLPIPLKVKYKIKGTARPQQCVSVEDISGLGVKVCVEKLLEINKPVEVSIIMPDDPKPIKATGKIAWCREFEKNKYKAGIAFIKIRDNFRFTELLCKNILDLSLG